MTTTPYEPTARAYFCSVCGEPAPNKWSVCAKHKNLTPAQKEAEKLRLRSNRPRQVQPPREFPQGPAQKLCSCGKPIRNVPDYLLDLVTLCEKCARRNGER